MASWESKPRTSSLHIAVDSEEHELERLVLGSVGGPPPSNGVVVKRERSASLTQQNAFAGPRASDESLTPPTGSVASKPAKRASPSYSLLEMVILFAVFMLSGPLLIM